MISVSVAISQPRLQALQKANLPVPPPVTANLLVDTGASNTNLDCAIVQKLGIQPSNQIGVSTPTTGKNAVMLDVYDVNLYLHAPDGTAKAINSLPVIESDFSAQNIDGLLGRDILSMCLLLYNGQKQDYQLVF